MWNKVSRWRCPVDCLLEPTVVPLGFCFALYCVLTRWCAWTWSPACFSPCKILLKRGKKDPSFTYFPTFNWTINIEPGVKQSLTSSSSFSRRPPFALLICGRFELVSQHMLHQWLTPTCVIWQRDIPKTVCSFVVSDTGCSAKRANSNSSSTGVWRWCKNLE